MDWSEMKHDKCLKCGSENLAVVEHWCSEYHYWNLYCNDCHSYDSGTEYNQIILPKKYDMFTEGDDYVAKTD